MNSVSLAPSVLVFQPLVSFASALQESDFVTMLSLLQSDHVPTLDEAAKILVQAILMEDRSLVQEVLRVCPEAAKMPDSDGELPLYWAVSGDMEIFNLVLDAYPDAVSHQNKDGETPLHEAVNEESNFVSIEQIRALLAVNPNVGLICNNEGKTPLFEALLFGTAEMIHELLKACPESARVKNKRENTPLHYVLNNLTVSSTEEVATKLILAWPQGLREKNRLKQTPIELARLHSNSKIVGLLEAAEKALTYAEETGLAWLQMQPLWLENERVNRLFREKVKVEVSTDPAQAFERFLHDPLMDQKLFGVIHPFLFPSRNK